MTENFIKKYLEELYQQGYRYLATDDGLTDWVYSSEPEMDLGIWECDTGFSSCLPFNLGLTSVEDTKAKSIAELLGIDEVNWSKIPIDTKILVSDDDESWCKRHFAKYENEKVYAWEFGFTSWTTGSFRCYNYAKLAEEPIEEPKQEKEPTINLDGVEKGTLVKVSSDGKQWYVRPFEGIKKKNVVTKEGKTIKKWSYGKLLDDKDLAFYSEEA